MLSLVPKKTRDDVYRFLFTEGAIACKKDRMVTWQGKLGGKKFTAPVHHVWYLLRSMVSRNLVKEQFAWRHFYWTLNDNGVAYLRKYLHLAETVVPETHQKSAKEVEDEKERDERRAKRDAAGTDGRGRGRGRGFGRGRGGDRGGRGRGGGGGARMVFNTKSTLPGALVVWGGFGCVCVFSPYAHQP